MAITEEELKKRKKLVEYTLMMHSQNLNGRESETELFELGIEAGIIEAQEQFKSELSNHLKAFSEEVRKKGKVMSNFDGNGRFLNHTISKESINQTLTDYLNKQMKL